MERRRRTTASDGSYPDGYLFPLETAPVTARTVQGIARVRSGQAPAWPLVSDRSVRRGSGVKRDFACALTRHFSPVLVVLRAQSRLRLEGWTRTLSGPSPDLSRAGVLALNRADSWSSLRESGCHARRCV
jgi:hypothetical protein